MLGAVETGGTKFRAAIFDADLEIVRETRVPTTDPGPTMDATVHFFRSSGLEIDALGIAAFGPLDLRPGSQTYGSILATPKPDWSGVRVLDMLRSALEVPTAIETDTGGAALAEAASGAGRGARTVVYVTVGTGIGGAICIDGRLHHGHGHPELGHIPVQRLDGDEFPGSCPYHGDCLEGLASGSAAEARFPDRHDDDVLSGFEAGYLAQLVRAITYLVAPDCIVFGGGLITNPELLPSVRVEASRSISGYSTSPQVADDMDAYVRAAELGQNAGLVGAAMLALRALGRATG